MDTEREGSLHDTLRRDVGAIVGAEQEAARETPIEVALHAVAPRPVPSVVLSIAGKTPQAVADALTQIPKQLDDIVARYPVKLELRLDALPGFSERLTAASLVLRLGVPVVFTLRARREGGLTTSTEPERQRLLMSMVGGMRNPPPPGSLLDVEAAAVADDPAGWQPVLQVAHARGFHVLLSHHDLHATPERGRTLLPPEGLLDGTPGGGALLWKSATTVRTWSQERALLRAMRRGNGRHRRAAVMGMGSATSRLLAPFFGVPLAYAAVSREQATAPGQPAFGDLVRLWARWGIDVDDEALAAPARDGAEDWPPRLVLLGRPAWHSLSPALHNAAAHAADLPHRYFPLEIPEHTGSGSARSVFEETLLDLPNLGVVGGNVTVPYKRLLAEVADKLEGDAVALGVANTFRFEGDHVLATNTDAAGVSAALSESGFATSGQNVLVLGAGGAAAAAAYACRDHTVTLTNRTRERAEALAQHLGGAPQVVDWDARAAAAQKADLIIHATSLGMAGGPAPQDPVLPADALRADQRVFDLVYTPLETPLLQTARAADARAIDGLTLLLHQGVAAFTWWTGAAVDLDAVKRGLQRASAIAFPEGIRSATALEVEG